MATFDLNAITFELDTTLLIQSSFNVVSTGAPFDPDTVWLYLRDPLGNLMAYTGAQLSHASMGVFTFSLTPSLAGGWTYKFQGLSAGGLDVTTPDEVFFINPSPAMGQPALAPPYYGPSPPLTPIVVSEPPYCWV